MYFFEGIHIALGRRRVKDVNEYSIGTLTHHLQIPMVLRGPATLIKNRSYFQMARKKAVDELSADELYALAQERQQEEEEEQRHAVKQEIDNLKQERRELVTRHRKELAEIDSKIKKLGGRTRARSRSAVNVTDAVLAIVQAAGEISTKDIKAELDRQGVVASNLSQTLAYLKRQGRVSSPHRSVYAA